MADQQPTEQRDLFDLSNPNEADDLPVYTGLPARERKFVDMYLMYWQGRKAAIYAGYAESNATTISCKLLNAPTIKAALSERQRQIKAESQIKHTMITEYLMGVVTCGIHDVLVQEVDPETKAAPTKAGARITKGVLSLADFERLKMSGAMRYVEGITIGKHGVTIRLFSKQAAIEMLARHTGYFEADNLQKGTGADSVMFYMPDNNRPNPGANETVSVGPGQPIAVPRVMQPEYKEGHYLPVLPENDDSY